MRATGPSIIDGIAAIQNFLSKMFYLTSRELMEKEDVPYHLPLMIDAKFRAIFYIKKIFKAYLISMDFLKRVP